MRQAWLAETQQLTAVGTQQGLSMMEALATQLGGSLPASMHAKVLLGRLIGQEARLLAFNDSFVLFVVICVIGLVLTLFFRRAQAPGP